MGNKPYHKYVFDEKNRKFIGDFDKMYAVEKIENFDSWNQDDVDVLDKKICLDILKQINNRTIIDIGCGKGALTHLMKKKDNSVIGLDISPKAVCIARKRFSNIEFFTTDIQDSSWVNRVYQLKPSFKDKGVDCVVCLETLSYIKKWQRVIRDFSALGKLALIKLFLPDNPIGFVKSNDDILLEFSKYYDVIHHIDIHSMQRLVLFGKSKAI